MAMDGYEGDGGENVGQDEYGECSAADCDVIGGNGTGDGDSKQQLNWPRHE